VLSSVSFYSYQSLEYIAQGHRFNIFEEIGCYPFTYNTPVAFALVSAPPIAIGVVSATYSIMSIRAFNKSRAQFNEFLSNCGHSNINNSRYIRLMCLAAAELFCTIPFGCYAIYLNAHDGGMRPWKGWADTHSHFSRVQQIPSILWRSNTRTEISLELTRWLIVFCAFIFFAFFGFADEAKKNYRSGLSTIAKKVGINTETLFGSSGGLTSSNGYVTLFPDPGAGTESLFIS
jgi:pheromone a factor receptor